MLGNFEDIFYIFLILKNLRISVKKKITYISSKNRIIQNIFHPLNLIVGSEENEIIVNLRGCERNPLKVLYLASVGSM